jgi:hypothetical protein
MAFEDLTPQSREFITALASRVADGTHAPEIVRYSGNISDPRSRIVQKGAAGNEDYVMFLEGYSAGDSFQRLIVKGLLKGGWVEGGEVWEGAVDESAVEAYRAG